MIWNILGTARDLGRLNDIAVVLIRYGMGDLVRRLGLGRLLEEAGRRLHPKRAEDMAHLEPPQRVRLALQELGPTFIKLGQVLSTRVDILPPDWIKELEKLQDQVPAVDFEELRAQLEEDLGRPPEEVFPLLEKQALAAGSIAQVHRARLADGSDVVLKIRRPNIKKTVEADLRLLDRLAELAEKDLPEIKRYRPREVVRQFAVSMRRELDFEFECRAAERVAANFSNQPQIVIPSVYWDWTCERLNVQRYIDGVPARDLAALDAAGLDRKTLARHGAGAVLQMILIDGIFHADPHQGNLFFLPGNHIALIDFGMVGHLSAPRRAQVADLLWSVVSWETDGIVEILLDWAGDAPIDAESLGREVDTFLEHYHGLPLKEVNFSSMLSELMAVVREHQLNLPPDLAMLFKAFISLEGLGRKLDPDFNIVDEARPFLRRVLRERYRPRALAQRGWKSLTGNLNTLMGLPQDVRRLLRMARRGALQIHIDLTRLDHFGHQLDRAASRLSVGLVTAALIVATSIALTQGTTGPTLFGLPLFAVVGFVGACVGGLWLLISIWRGGRF